MLLSIFDFVTDEILKLILNSNEFFNLHESMYIFHFLLLLNWSQNWLQSRNNIAANFKFKLTRSNLNHKSNNKSRLSSNSELSLLSSLLSFSSSSFSSSSFLSSSFSSSSFSSSLSKKLHNKQFVKKMLWKQLTVKSRIDDRKLKLIKVSFESY